LALTGRPVEVQSFERNGKTYRNFLVSFGPQDGERIIVGAHYDGRDETPGADDNASAVAVLLELGRLLMDRPPAVPLRLVAFGTEEPPSFGTRNMGSAQYALSLQKEGIPLAGMVSLEMLGYYNPRPKSQLYPPVLDRYYPDTGTFVSLVSNFNSRGLLKPFKNNWPKNAAVPLETLVLPGPLSSLALSDQLNFWDAGFPAVMLSDTAYFRNPHYHMSSDTADTLDYDKMADVTRTLSDVLSNLPAESPQ
jgi:Zn-dependent M28 family amino/carboxypeptidase